MTSHLATHSHTWHLHTKSLKRGLKAPSISISIAMNKIFHFVGLILIVLSCSEREEKQQITDAKDYSVFLNSNKKPISNQLDDVAFWKEKIDEEPRGFIYYEKLGVTYLKVFEETRDVNYLHKADSVFRKCERVTQGKWKLSSLIHLSSVSIKKHDFSSAAKYAVEARELAEEKLGPLLMQFDAEMELGNYQMAGAILNRNRQLDSFDYLVRLSKYKDYEGDLDSAIFYMERASSLLKAHQKENLVWSTLNLGDMYGHAGKIAQSYEVYLKALQMDSTNDYALKGIAWIAYSHDRDVEAAKEILEELISRSRMPDYYLMLSEINEFEGNSYEADFYKEMFLTEASKSVYDGMYNKYLISIYSEKEAFNKALSIAQEEVDKRPTPESYDWLAWTLYENGDLEKALSIYEEHIEGRTYEPDPIYHMGVVYDHAGRSRSKSYLKESLEATFELGPISERNIKSLLKI